MTQDEFRAKFSGGHIGDALDYKQRLNTIADFLNPTIEAISASTTVAAEDTNKTFGVGVDGLVVTLPLAAPGLKYTFINTGADGAVALTLSPNALDAIVGTVANAAADSVSGGVVNKDFVNTKATANKGDRITIVGAANAWYIVEGVGIWASEA